jgi:predicted HicB family RNase H-like nuclease
MAKRKKIKKSESDINDENEFLKLKMMAEFGGNFMGSENLPADVENMFLKQIMSFHKRQNDAKLVPIYKYIGEPEYNHVNDLSEKEVTRDLKKIMRLLKKYNIGLEVLAPTPEREIYRFITEELFKHEIEDTKVKGWVNQFIYEEFHPNAEYDVKNAVHFALLSLFDKEAAFFHEQFSETMKDRLGLSTDSEELREKIEAFQSQFYNVTLVHYDFVRVSVDRENKTAKVWCDVVYKTQKEKGKRSKREFENIEFTLRQDEESESWWLVTSVFGETF